MPQWLAGLVAALTVLAGFAFCDGSARYRDVSNVAPYAQVVGSVCDVKLTLRAHGVTAIGSPYQHTDYVTVWGGLGFTGPEVTFVEDINPGVKLWMRSARKCWNCPFDDLVDFAVEVEPRPERFGSVPVYVRAEVVTDNYMECKK